MTIDTQSSKVVAQGNGLAIVWPFSFLVPDADSLFVEYTNALGVSTLIAPGNYSVVGLNNPSGGAVTYPLVGAPIAAGTYLTIYRRVAYVQETDIENQSNFLPNVLEGALDYEMMCIQQLQEVTSRALTIPITEDPTSVNTVLPSAPLRAGGTMCFDGLGNLIVVDGNDGIAVGGVTYSTLAAAGGSALLGFKQAGASTVLRTVQDELRETVKATQWGPATFAHLQALIADIGATPTTLIFPSSSGVWPVTDNITFPSTVDVVMQRGASFNITKNKTVTINGGLVAGRYSIFSFDSTYTFLSPNFLIPVSFARGMTVFPEWFGATGGNIAHDDRPGLQAAIDSLWQRGVFKPGATTYYINSIGRADYIGNTCGVYCNNDPTVNGHTAGIGDTPAIIWECAGGYNTIFSCLNSLGLGNLICIHAQGEGAQLNGGFLANVTVDSGAQGTACVAFIGCNPLTHDPIYTGGGLVGLLYQGVAGATVYMGLDEFSTCGTLAVQCSQFTLLAATSFEGIAAETQINIVNTVANVNINGRVYAGMTAWALDTQPGPIVVCATINSNILTESVGLTINIEDATAVPMILIGPSIGTNALDPTQTGGYDLNVVACHSFSMVGGALWHGKYGSLFGSGRYKFTGVDVSNAGMYDQQTAPWAVRALQFLGTTSTVEILNCNFQNIAGNAIYSKAKSTKIAWSSFIDCANGGLLANKTRANAVNATCGVQAVLILPQSADTIIEVKDNKWSSPFALGKTGLSIDCAAGVPAATNVKISGNDVVTASFATPYSVGTATALQQAAWYIHQDGLAGDTPVIPPSYADGNAPNSTLYYSTTASKLVYKDGGGVVNNLY